MRMFARVKHSARHKRRVMESIGWPETEVAELKA